jgi:hypothetical protein
MKIITRGVLDWDGNILEESAYDYHGPLARCGDAYNLQDLKQLFPLIPSGVNAAAPTTTSGNWVDVSNWVGDSLILLDLSAQVGGFGSVKVQVQTAASNTGAGAANFTADTRNAGLLTAVALGIFAIPIDTDAVPNNFVGVTCTYTTVTSATFGVTLLGRLPTN